MPTVKLPGDYLTTSQRTRLNGLIATYDLKSPTDLETIKTWPTDIQLEYCNSLIEKYGAATAAFAQMFGVPAYKAREYLDGIGVKKLKGMKMKSEQKAEWHKFLGIEPAVSGEEAPVKIYGKDFAECADCVYKDGNNIHCDVCVDADRYDDGKQCGNCKHRHEPVDSVACQECFGDNFEPIDNVEPVAVSVPAPEPEPIPEPVEAEPVESVEPASTDEPEEPKEPKAIPVEFKLVFGSDDTAVDVNEVCTALKTLLGDKPNGTLRIKWYKRRYL